MKILKNFLVPISILLILVILNLTGLSSEIIKVIFLVLDRYNSYILKVFISIIIYILGSCTIVPVNILNYFMGVLFGYPFGILIALLSNALSCTLAYWLFRYINIRFSRTNMFYSNLLNKVKKTKKSFIFNNTCINIAYACLILPFSVIVSTITYWQNIRFKTYILGMLLGTAPSCMAYSFLGTLNIKVNPLSIIIFSILIILLFALPSILKIIYSSLFKNL